MRAPSGIAVGRPGFERAVLLACALALAVLAATFAPKWRGLPDVPGIDFSFYWGVSHVRAALAPGHTNPYRYVQEYDAAARARADSSGDRRLAEANAERPNFDLTNTPLLYASAAIYPADYSRALSWHRGFALGAFVVAVLAIARNQGRLRGWQLCALPVLTFAWEPLLSDLRAGNVGAVQLALLAAAVALARAAQSRPAWGLANCALLPLVTMFKPNFAFPSLLLWIATVRALPVSLRVAGAGVTVASVAAGFYVAGRVFTAPAIWLDWLTMLFAEQNRLGYDFLLGNFSTNWWLVQTRGGDSRAVGVAMSALLMLVMTWLPLRGVPPVARRMLALPSTARAAFWAAIGIVVTLGCSPLVWYHYYVLAVLPVLLLLLAPTALFAVRLCGALGLLASSGGWVHLALLIFGSKWPWLRAVVCLGWVPLALGLAALQWEAGRRVADTLDPAPAGPRDGNEASPSASLSGSTS